MDPTAGSFSVAGRYVFDIAGGEVQQVHLIKWIARPPLGLENHQRHITIKIPLASAFSFKRDLSNTRKKFGFNFRHVGVIRLLRCHVFKFSEA